MEQHASQNAPYILCHSLDCVHATKGERLVEELAPELTPMLASLEMPANIVPVTNAVFAEMAEGELDGSRSWLPCARWAPSCHRTL